MNVREALEADHSKYQVERITNYIGEDPERFEELMTIFFATDSPIINRFAWVVSTAIQKNPVLAGPYLEAFLDMLEKSELEPVKRNITRLFQFVEIPEQLDGRLYDLCFKLLYSVKEAIAVRAFSMSVCGRIACRYPDLKQELVPVLEHLAHSSSAGIRARSRNVLKLLRKKS